MNQHAGRAAVRATIIAPGGGIDAQPCGVDNVPAVSEWGLGILALLAMVTGTVAFRRVVV